MKSTEIIAMQKVIGVEPDGFWGPKSQTACQAHLRKLMPLNNPWPKADQKSLQAFYGSPGDESKLTPLNISDLGIKYEGNHVQRILCHSKVAQSLRRILVALKTSPFASLLNSFDGCYNNRPMRGSTTPSLHSRGAAIDFDAANNANLSHWPDNASMPLGVMEIFAREGWLSAGAFWSRDAMHFQATL